MTVFKLDKKTGIYGLVKIFWKCLCVFDKKNKSIMFIAAQVHLYLPGLGLNEQYMSTGIANIQCLSYIGTLCVFSFSLWNTLLLFPLLQS